MKGNWGLLLLVLALVVGLMVGYFRYCAKETGKPPTLHEAEKMEAKDLEDTEEKGITAKPPTIQAPQKKLEEILREKAVESRTMSIEDECQKMEADLKEFFKYLDKQDYIRKLGIEEGTFNRFKKIVYVLSLHPPVPAGEGLNYDTIIKNIYHFTIAFLNFSYIIVGYTPFY